MDGQTEHVNRTLEQILQNSINYWQMNWNDILPNAEFMINSTVSASTGFTPFELMYGINPSMPADLTDKELRVPAAEEFISNIAKMVKTARDNIIKAQANQKHFADQHQHNHNFKIGDMVLLNIRNIYLPDKHTAKL